MSGIEVLGIAASVIQIADAGARLSSKLFVFTRKVKNADQSISHISQEIEMTGAALRELGEALEDEKYASMGSQRSIDTTSQIVADCWKVFTDINDTIGGEQLVKPRNSHNEKSTSALTKFKQPSFTFKQRLRFPYIEPQINLLKAKLESLKSSLMLMLQVLLLAEQAKNRPKLAVSEEQTALLQTLLDERNAKEAEFRSSCMAIDEAPTAPSDLESFDTNDSISADTLVTNKRELEAAPSACTISPLCEPGNAFNVFSVNPLPRPSFEHPFARTETTKTIAGTTACSSPSAMKLTPVTSSSEGDSSSSSTKKLPRSLQMRQQDIEHHAQLVQNLLDEVSDIQYRIDHGIRHRMHDGVLKLHWDEWSPHASKHGHEHFHECFKKHEHIARYWVDQEDNGATWFRSRSASPRVVGASNEASPMSERVQAHSGLTPFRAAEGIQDQMSPSHANHPIRGSQKQAAPSSEQPMAAQLTFRLQTGTDAVLASRERNNLPESLVDTNIPKPGSETALEREQVRVCQELFSEFDHGGRGRIPGDILGGALEKFLVLSGYSSNLEVDTEGILDLERNPERPSSEEVDIDLFTRCAARCLQIQMAYEENTVLLRIFDKDSEEMNDGDELKEVVRSLGGAISDEEYDVFVDDHAKNGTRQLRYADCLDLLRRAKLLIGSEAEIVTQSIAEDRDKQNPLAVVKLHRRTYQQHIKAVQEHEQWRTIRPPLIGREDHEAGAFRLQDALDAGTVGHPQTDAHIKAGWPRWAFAMWGYQGTAEADLSFGRGDFIEILSEGDGTWWVGRRLGADPGKPGCVPSNYVSYMPVSFVPSSLTCSDGHLSSVASEEVDETQTKIQDRMRKLGFQQRVNESLDHGVEKDQKEAKRGDFFAMRVPDIFATSLKPAYVQEDREPPLYVNDRQFHRILKRRVARRKLEEKSKDISLPIQLPTPSSRNALSEASTEKDARHEETEEEGAAEGYEVELPEEEGVAVGHEIELPEQEGVAEGSEEEMAEEDEYDVIEEANDSHEDVAQGLDSGDAQRERTSFGDGWEQEGDRFEEAEQAQVEEMAEAEEDDVSPEADVVGDAARSDEQSDDMSEDENDVPSKGPRKKYSSYSRDTARPGSKITVGDHLADQTLGSWDNEADYAYTSSCDAQEPLDSAQRPVKGSALSDGSSSSLVQEEKGNSSKVNGKRRDDLLEEAVPRSAAIKNLYAMRSTDRSYSNQDDYATDSSGYAKLRVPINEALNSASASESSDTVALPPEIIEALTSKITANVMQQLKASTLPESPKPPIKQVNGSLTSADAMPQNGSVHDVSQQELRADHELSVRRVPWDDPEARVPGTVVSVDVLGHVVGLGDLLSELTNLDQDEIVRVVG